MRTEINGNNLSSTLALPVDYEWDHSYMAHHSQNVPQSFWGVHRDDSKKSQASLSNLCPCVLCMHLLAPQLGMETQQSCLCLPCFCLGYIVASNSAAIHLLLILLSHHRPGGSIAFWNSNFMLHFVTWSPSGLTQLMKTIILPALIVNYSWPLFCKRLVMDWILGQPHHCSNLPGSPLRAHRLLSVMYTVSCK